MQTFFKENPEINKWVDLLVEKLITINILNGNDADSEFHESRLLVEKIAKAFQEIIDLPQEALIDGIQQLVEQKLPDKGVVDNFPDFFLFMNKVINAGLQSTENDHFEIENKEVFPQQVANLKLLKDKCTDGTSTSKVILNGSFSVAQEMDSSFSLREHLLRSMEAYNTFQSDKTSSNPDKDSVNKDVFVLDEPLSDGTSNEKLTTGDPARTSLADVPMADLTKEISQLSQPLEKELQIMSSELEAPQMGLELDDSQIISPHLEESELLSPPLPEAFPALSTAIREVYQEHYIVKPQEPKESRETQVTHETKVTQETQVTHETNVTQETQEYQKPQGKPKAQPRDPFRFNKRKKTLDELREELDGKQISSIKIARQPNMDDTLISKQEGLQVPHVLFQETPEGCRGLEQALKKIFPQSPIHWYVTIEDYSFLAKCEGVLIYLLRENDEFGTMVKEMKNLGYDVVVCQDQDLRFPRRLERILRFRNR